MAKLTKSQISTVLGNLQAITQALSTGNQAFTAQGAAPTPMDLNAFLANRESLNRTLETVKRYGSQINISPQLQQQINQIQSGAIPNNIKISSQDGNVDANTLSKLKSLGYSDSAVQQLNQMAADQLAHPEAKGVGVGAKKEKVSLAQRQANIKAGRDPNDPTPLPTAAITTPQTTQTVQPVQTQQTPQQGVIQTGQMPSGVSTPPVSSTVSSDSNGQGYTIIDPKTNMVTMPNGQKITLEQYKTQTSAPQTTQGGVAGGYNGSQIYGGQNLQSALDFIDKSDLDEGTKTLYREVIRNWNPESEINFQNILSTFDQISKKTIDPEFAERTKIAMDEITRARDYLQSNADLEKESERMQGQQNIEGTQADLEARGLTFSGKAIEELGAQSAYAQAGSPQAAKSAIPLQEPFGGKFEEGNVLKQNRLMSTSGEARRKKQLQDLQRSAELQLGSAATQGLITGIGQLGGITGQMEKEKEASKAGLLSDLYSQEQQNVAAREPLKPLS